MKAEVQHLSHSFRTDAAHLIIKARCANNPKESPSLRTSYIAKLVVDAYMACECALKSMIAATSHDKSGAEVYATIRKCGHKLPLLMELANPKSLNKNYKKFLEEASELGVSLRYSLDLFSLATCELIPNDKEGFKNNEQFEKIDQTCLKTFLVIAKLLADEADERHSATFGTEKSALRGQPQRIKNNLVGFQKCKMNCC